MALYDGLARELLAQALEIEALAAHWAGVPIGDIQSQNAETKLFRAGALAIERLVEAIRNGELAPILCNRHFLAMSGAGPGAGGYAEGFKDGIAEKTN